MNQWIGDIQADLTEIDIFDEDSENKQSETKLGT